MSHVEELLENLQTPSKRRAANLTSVWNCYHSAHKSARVYRSGKTRRQSIRYTGPDLVAETEEDHHKEVLEVVAKTHWQVYKCSPLWNVKWKEREVRPLVEGEGEGEVPSNIMRMSLEGNIEREFDEQELKKVARIITSYVATHSASGEDCPYWVEVCPMRGMKGIRTDCEALSISVYTTMMEAEKRIFLGILCGVETAQLQLRSDDVVNLPLFLTVGNMDTRERVIYGLEKYFDCQISGLALPQLELKWMAAMWAGLEVRDASQEESSEEAGARKSPASKAAREELKMKYGVPLAQEPGQKQKIRHLTCTFPMGDIREIWKSIHPDEETEFTDDAMESFHQTIGAFIKEESNLDLDKAELIQISLPFLKAESSGKVMIERCDQVKMVLRYLTELCQGEMFSVDPTLAAQTQRNNTMDWV